LQSIAGRLENEFQTQIQESVEEHSPDGEITDGPPILIVSRCAALTADDVKAIASRMTPIAETEGVTYEGVECYDAVDEDELFDWMELEDATWRLRHFTDTGLEIDEELPWAFLITAENASDLQTAEQTLNKAGLARTQCFDDPDENGAFGMCLFVDGKNNESELVAAHRKFEELLVSTDAKLTGIQFFSEENLQDDSVVEGD
jgi:hypothetical protein